MAGNKPNFTVVMHREHMSSVAEKWACGYLRLSGWVFYLWHEYDNSFNVVAECSKCCSTTNDCIHLFNVVKGKKIHFWHLFLKIILRNLLSNVKAMRYWKPWWLFQLFSLRRSNSMVNIVELFSPCKKFRSIFCFTLPFNLFSSGTSLLSSNPISFHIDLWWDKRTKDSKRKGKRQSKKRRPQPSFLPSCGSLAWLKGKCCDTCARCSSDITGINLFLAPLSMIFVD